MKRYKTTQVNTRIDAGLVREMDDLIDGHVLLNRTHVITLALREWLFERQFQLEKESLKSIPPLEACKQ